MKKFYRIAFKTSDDYRSVLPRLIVSLVFISEGIQKFLFPGSVGAARFETIGFANPDFVAAFVGTFEVVCGALVLVGFSVRMASVPLLIIMLTAIATTKIPILRDEGFWKMAHEARTDFAMTLLTVFLLLYGASRLSADSTIMRRME